jgi:hypothetical protein
MIRFPVQCSFSKPKVIIAVIAATAPMAAVSERSVLLPIVAEEKPASLQAVISSLEKPPSGPAIILTGMSFPCSFQAENKDRFFSCSQRTILAFAQETFFNVLSRESGE